MLIPNAPPIKTSWCRWDEPQSLYCALRYHDRPRPLRWLGERLMVEVTDSKNPDMKPHVMTLGAWDRFLRHVHEWRASSDGLFHLGFLRFTEGEVTAFKAGVVAGDFYRHIAART